MVISSHALIHLTQNIKEDYTMEKYIYNNNNCLWYELQGDYYIPCLALDEEITQPIGIWGRKHLRYIKEHHPVLHTELLGKLWLWSFSNFDGGTIGMAVYVVIQMMVLSLAFTYVILVLKMLGMADKCCYITAVFLGVFPLNGFMAISATKDTIFSAFFVVILSFSFL